MLKSGGIKYKNKHSFITELENEYKNYFKFSFVRNPWDRLVSWYNMFLNLKVSNDFSKYVLNNSKNFSEFLNLTEIIVEKIGHDNPNGEYYPKSISFNQLDYLTNKEGNINVDFIGRYENINDDYRNISTKLNISLDLECRNKFNHDHYRTYYSDSDAEKVYHMYKRDIDYFGYEF
jgi:hypothetical protein